MDLKPQKRICSNQDRPKHPNSKMKFKACAEMDDDIKVVKRMFKKKKICLVSSKMVMTRLYEMVDYPVWEFETDKDYDVEYLRVLVREVEPTSYISGTLEEAENFDGVRRM